MANAIEVIKIIGTVISTIIGATTLCGICVKPLRKIIIRKIKEWSNSDNQSKVIQSQQKALNKEEKAIQEIKSIVENMSNVISDLNDRVFQNEKDRLRSELFNCGNRCRRGITLYNEEFRYIQGVYEKYSVELHCNSIGTDEYNFIRDYFYSKENQNKIK